jgi:hypothetical protein
MDNKKVHVIPTHYIPYGRHDILPEIISRPYYLPYALVLRVGVISKVVNKAAFDVSLCHDMFKWIDIV